MATHQILAGNFEKTVFIRYVRTEGKNGKKIAFSNEKDLILVDGKRGVKITQNRTFANEGNCVFFEKRNKYSGSSSRNVNVSLQLTNFSELTPCGYIAISYYGQTDTGSVPASKKLLEITHAITKFLVQILQSLYSL